MLTPSGRPPAQPLECVGALCCRLLRADVPCVRRKADLDAVHAQLGDRQAQLEDMQAQVDHLSAEARDAGTMRSRLKELADTNTQLHQEAQASLE